MSSQFSALQRTSMRRRSAPHARKDTNPLRTNSTFIDKPHDHDRGPPVLVLTPDSAMQFPDSLEDVLLEGGEPFIFIEEVDGLNPIFLQRVIEERPNTYVAGRAAFDLERQFHPPGLRSGNAVYVLAMIVGLTISMGFMIGKLLVP